MACTAKYPYFKFEVLNAFRVMITQGRLLHGLLYQFPGNITYNVWHHGPIQNGKMAAHMLL